MNPDGTLQLALSQLSEAGFWGCSEKDMMARLIAVARLHQAAPVVCAECGNAFPCATNLIAVEGAAQGRQS